MVAHNLCTIIQHFNIKYQLLDEHAYKSPLLNHMTTAILYVNFIIPFH